MYQIKRPSAIDESLIIEKKKFRTIFNKDRISITYIENFSNELFYEIFEYLDGFDLYSAFSNLNSRFKYLRDSSTLLLKIKLHSEANSELSHNCENIIIPNRHRILSLSLMDNFNDFLRYCTIDSSFNRLESIVITNLSVDKSVVLLFYLNSLPRLFSLTMDIEAEETGDFTDIYRMIFSLPSLKYNKLSLISWFDDEDMNILVPVTINEQLSTIEYLVIDRGCTFNMLLSMLQHTPQLCHLTCQSLTASYVNTNIKQPLNLPNLAYMHFTYPPSTLNDFGIFMKKICAKVQVLIMTYFSNETYLDADRWKRLIIKYMPHLHRFHLADHDYFSLDLESTSLNELVNRFTSPFWIKRQWVFEFVIHKRYNHYSISPYRNIWLDIYKHVEIATFFNRNIDYNSPQHVPQCLPLIQLRIDEIHLVEPHQSFIDKFKSTFATVQFTRLNINCKNISMRILVRMIHLLLNLNSLKISSLPLMQPGCLMDNDGGIYFLTSINNKITKVNLEMITNIVQVHFILYLCRCIQYFQIDVSKDMDIELLVRFILIKPTTYIPHLRSLCLTLPNANEEIVHQLQQTIESEKLLTNFMIKRICNHILLKWN